MPKTNDPFYVGYLPTPREHKRFTRFAAAALVVIAAGTGMLLGRLMNDPGDGVWDLSQTATVEGYLWTSPVPFIESDNGPILLVEQGKYGAHRAAGFSPGERVSATGFQLSRNDMIMLELESQPEAITVASDGDAMQPLRTDARRVVVRGEIVDSKCYLGAMKPGTGRTHAACARLCIRGGIPAVVVGTSGGQPFWAVIEPNGSEIISDDLLDAVGSPIRLEGVYYTANGLPILKEATIAQN